MSSIITHTIILKKRVGSAGEDPSEYAYLHPPVKVTTEATALSPPHNSIVELAEVTTKIGEKFLKARCL